MPDQPQYPKTLIVDLAKGYGGATSRVLSLLVNSPRERIALAGLESGLVVKRAQELGLRVHVVGKSKMDLRILPRLIRLIRDEGFEVLDTQNIQAKFWASMAALWTRCALVSTIHSWYASEHGKTSPKGIFYTVIELLTSPTMDFYITVSEKDRDMLIKSGFPKDMIHLIYNAVNIDPEKISGDGSWLKQKFHLPPNSIVCTAVGRLVWMKGHAVLIDAMKKIADDVPELVTLIVGEGELKSELQEHIKQSGLQGRIQLVGYHDRDAVLSIVKSSDIFAMPSHYEGTPVALLEAAALARPILSTLAGGIPEMVENGEQALLVPSGDADALSSALLRLATDKDYSRTLGLKAQDQLRQRFSIERQLIETWSVYRKAWSKHHTTN